MLQLALVTTTQFRPLRSSDAATVKRWLNSYLGEHLERWEQAYRRKSEASLHDLVDRDWEELLEASDSGDSFIRVMEATSPIGIVSARKQIERFLGFEVGVLAWIYVDESARARGVAAALMEAADGWMSEQGVKGRQVYVTISNAAAVKLYQRHGFEAVDYRMLAPSGSTGD